MAAMVSKINEWVAEVESINCAQPLDAGDLATVQEAFRDYPVLAFPSQRLEATELAGFARQFGELEDQINAEHVHPDDDHVLILSNEIRPDGTAVGVVDAGDDWHSDSSHRPAPSKATVLHAVRTPSVGGDTLFCNMYQVYDSLRPELKEKICGLHGVHCVSKIKNPRVKISDNRPGAREFYLKSAQEKPEVLQPMVRTHPETGRPSLYVSARFTIRIDELDDEEGQPILDELFEAVLDERFHYRHHWTDNQLVMWDNRCLNHKATGDFPRSEIRRMHRTVLVGDEAYFRPDQAE